jgi:hypothetical protein
VAVVAVVVQTGNSQERFDYGLPDGILYAVVAPSWVAAAAVVAMAVVAAVVAVTVVAAVVETDVVVLAGHLAT